MPKATSMLAWRTHTSVSVAIVWTRTICRGLRPWAIVCGRVRATACRTAEDMGLSVYIADARVDARIWSNPLSRIRVYTVIAMFYCRSLAFLCLHGKCS